MDKSEVIIRRILGWKLNSHNKWFDSVNRRFVTHFDLENNLDDAMLIVQQLEKFGYVFTKKGENEVCFNDICATGNTLTEAIVNAAYEVAEVDSTPSEWL